MPSEVIYKGQEHHDGYGAPITNPFPQNRITTNYSIELRSQQRRLLLRECPYRLRESVKMEVSIFIPSRPIQQFYSFPKPASMPTL